MRFALFLKNIDAHPLTTKARVSLLQTFLVFKRRLF